MKVEQIRSEADVLTYIEGIVNDFATGLTDQDETEKAIADLVLFVAKKAAKK